MTMLDEAQALQAPIGLRDVLAALPPHVRAEADELLASRISHAIAAKVLRDHGIQTSETAVRRYRTAAR